MPVMLTVSIRSMKVVWKTGYEDAGTYQLRFGISDDEFIRRQVRKISVGDQIRLRGYLASYTSEGGSTRGTSTTRTDTGDGACETIYVQHFNIVEAATSYWRLSMWASLALLVTGLVIHFRRPYRPY